FLAFAAISGFLSVALGAFGAHALKATLPPNLLATFHTGVDYQMAHTLAVFAVALAAKEVPRSLKISGLAFAVGILIFSGSLYLLVFTQQTWLGAITPIGGVCFLVGWLSLIFFAFRKDI
ncbi:UNVERIFIED_CONTAM: hypothetical protein GTU68_031117, partial [Idotea baltica]|nr:hypothetical protein [Idotea baltica]